MESLYAVSTGAKQRCSRDRGERALSIQDVVSLGIVQPILDGAEHVHVMYFALYECPYPAVFPLSRAIAPPRTLSVLCAAARRRHASLAA